MKKLSAKISSGLSRKGSSGKPPVPVYASLDIKYDHHEPEYYKPGEEITGRWQKFCRWKILNFFFEGTVALNVERRLNKVKSKAQNFYFPQLNDFL